MPNVELEPYSRPSMWRRMSFANWREARDPQVYGRVEVDMTAVQDYARAESARTGEKITPTHMMIRALALGLRDHPDANVLLRLGRTYRRKQVDIFCQVAIPGAKPDLSGATLRRVDEKPPAVIARELREGAEKVRTGKDKELGDTRKLLNWFPPFIMRFMLWLVGILTYTFNLDLRSIGLPRDPFGGAMITSVGMLGIDEGYAPLVPMSHVPLLLALGKIRNKPVANDAGGIEVRPMCVLTATFDHRLMDGFTGGRLTRTVLGYLADPVSCERQESGERTEENEA